MRGRGRRMIRRLPSAALALLVVIATIGLVVAASSHSASADATTGGGGDLRNGWIDDQPTLSTSTVDPGSFGKLDSTAVDGQVMHSP